MARREQTSEPAFGSDSFLDVTANLVGVLIILIVLVGLRVAKSPPRPAAVEAEFARRLAAGKSRIDDLNRDRLELERQLADSRQGFSAKQAALLALARPNREQSAAVSSLNQQLAHENRQLDSQAAELADARSRLVSLGREFDEAKDAAVRTAQKLVHQSPLSSVVRLPEVHLELQAGRVAFIDEPRLSTWLDNRLRPRQVEIRASRHVTEEVVGPVGYFRLKYTLTPKDMSYSRAMLSGSLAASEKYEFIPAQDPRGEPVGLAVQPNSELGALLDRHSPNKFAITIWTYPDSFLAFRQLRDYLSDRGYVVAARPKRFDELVTFSTEGTRSTSQ